MQVDHLTPVHQTVYLQSATVDVDSKAFVFQSDVHFGELGRAQLD